MHGGTRNKVVAVAVGILALVVGSETAAFANDAPMVTQTVAAFRIPAGDAALWELSLWSHGQLLGRVSGHSGVLKLVVPRTADCVFQADVRSGAPGHMAFYSGVHRRLAACGVARTALSTSVSAATVGTPVTDVAVLTGASAGAGGTITFDAYGPVDPTCASAPVFVGHVAVAGPGTYGPVSFTPSQGAGAYHWIARYSGDSANRLASEACGAPQETSQLTTASHSEGNKAPPPATAVAQTSGPTDTPVTGATSVHTGEPWSGSEPYAAGAGGAGLLLTGTGLLRRRRMRVR